MSCCGGAGAVCQAALECGESLPCRPSEALIDCLTVEVRTQITRQTIFACFFFLPGWGSGRELGVGVITSTADAFLRHRPIIANTVEVLLLFNAARQLSITTTSW